MDEATRAGWRLALRLLVAHHPLCRHFDDDVLHLGSVRLCTGCLATWPLFVAALLLVPTLGLLGAGPAALLATGLTLGVPQAIAAWRGAGRGWSVAAKVVGGPGLAVALWGWFLLPAPPAMLLLLLALAAAALMALLWRRMRRMLLRCDACPWQREWDQCPGMLRHQQGWHEPSRSPS